MPSNQVHHGLPKHEHPQHLTSSGQSQPRSLPDSMWHLIIRSRDEKLQSLIICMALYWETACHLVGIITDIFNISLVRVPPAFKQPCWWNVQRDLFCSSSKRLGHFRHLEHNAPYIGMLFVVFSFAFNTIMKLEHHSLHTSSTKVFNTGELLVDSETKVFFSFWSFYVLHCGPS